VSRCSSCSTHSPLGIRRDITGWGERGRISRIPWHFYKLSFLIPTLTRTLHRKRAREILGFRKELLARLPLTQ
jgi:hypothetical protein